MGQAPVKGCCAFTFSTACSGGLIVCHIVMLIILLKTTLIGGAFTTLFIFLILGAAAPLLNICVSYEVWRVLSKFLIVLLIIGSMYYISAILYVTCLMTVLNFFQWDILTNYCGAFIVYAFATALLYLGAYIPTCCLYNVPVTTYTNVSAGYAPPQVAYGQPVGMAVSAPGFSMTVQAKTG